jgi:hypothetical protein
MKRLAVLLLLAASAFAQSPGVHEAVPLTDTRYGRVDGTAAHLASNGTDTFLFWNRGSSVLVTKLDGEKRVGRIVTSAAGQLAGVTWNGTTFVLGIDTGKGISGQLLDRYAEAVGGPFTISTGRVAALALRGTTTLVVSAQPIITFVEVSPAGHVSQARLLHPAAAARIDVTSNGSGFAVAYTNGAGSNVIVLDAANLVLLDRTMTAAQPALSVVSIASDGHDYLLVTRDDNRDVLATPISRHGDFGRTLRLGTSSASSLPIVTWDGDAWVVASDVDETLRVDRVDPHAELVLDSRTIDEASGLASVCRCAGSLKLAWRNGNRGYDLLDLSSNEIAETTYGAAWQHVLATTSSPDGTLVVWQEWLDGARTLRAGLRGPNGTWIERPIGDADHALAASKGRELAVVRVTGGRTDIVRLDTSLRIVASTSLAMGSPLAMTANANDFAILGMNADATQFIAERWSGTGTAPPPVVVTADLHVPVNTATFASNGSTFLAAWQELRLGFPPWNPVETRVRALDASLQPMSAQPAVYVEESQPTAAWNGSDYLVATYQKSDDGLLFLRTVSSQGVETGRRTIWSTHPEIEFEGLQLATNGAYALLVWTNTASWYEAEEHVAVLDRSGQPLDDDLLVPVSGATRITAMHTGGFAVVSDHLRTEAPHHGAQRVTFRTVNLSKTQKPDAPYDVTVRRYNGQFRIEWESNGRAVDGYRVEYKIGDGQWLELSRWFDADERVAAWPSVKPNTTYSFRVRAWSEVGVSAYSNVATGNAVGKRRAVN